MWTAPARSSLALASAYAFGICLEARPPSCIAALDRDLAGALAALDASKPASLRRVLWYAEERIAAARLAGGSGDVEVAVGALPVQALAHYSSAAVSDSAWGVVRVKSC